jgi:hypothetical protein
MYTLVLKYSQTIDEFKPDFFGDIQRDDDYDELWAELCRKEKSEREIYYGPTQEHKTYTNLREANKACKELFRDTVAYTLDFSEHMTVDNIDDMMGGEINYGLDWIDEYVDCRHAPDGRVSYSHSENYGGSNDFANDGMKWSFSASCQVIKSNDDE